MSLDAVIYALFLIISLAIGMLAGRRVKGLRDYYVAGASMPWYMLCGTFIASNVSAGLFLGGTDMTGTHGYTIWCSYYTTSVGYVLAIGVVGVLVKRLATQHQVYDFADIFAARYPSRSHTIRLVIAVCLPLVYVPTLAAQFMGLAAISSTLFDLSYQMVLVIVVGIVVIYTVLGGMLGVVWTDAFQFLVLLLGLVLAVPLAMVALGNGDAGAAWSQITALSPDLFKWTTTEWTWYAVVGQMVWIFSLSAQPHLVTRFLTAKDERTIIKALPVCLVAVLVIYASTVPVGLLGRLSGADLPAGDHYYIALARNTLGPLLGGFALVGIAAAAISTASTILIVTAQAFARDIYQRARRQDLSEAHLVNVSRGCVVLVGAASALLAYHRVLGIFWLIVLSGSLFAAIFFVPLLAGFFSRRASGPAALAAMIAGAAAATLIYLVNSTSGAHWFINELVGGLLFSALAWFAVSRRTRPSAAEDAVLAGLAAAPRSSETGRGH